MKDVNYPKYDINNSQIVDKWMCNLGYMPHTGCPLLDEGKDRRRACLFLKENAEVTEDNPMINYGLNSDPIDLRMDKCLHLTKKETEKITETKSYSMYLKNEEGNGFSINSITLKDKNYNSWRLNKDE